VTDRFDEDEKSSALKKRLDERRAVSKLLALLGAEKALRSLKTEQ